MLRYAANLCPHKVVYQYRNPKAQRGILTPTTYFNGIATIYHKVSFPLRVNFIRLQIYYNLFNPQNKLSTNLFNTLNKYAFISSYWLFYQSKLLQSIRESCTIGIILKEVRIEFKHFLPHS